MNSDTKHDRDPFTFSLRGAWAVNSHAMVPVVADDGINETWYARLRRQARPVPRTARQTTVAQQIEALLARYFAHDFRCAA